MTFQLEMNELRERLEIEKQGWIENYMKKQVRQCVDFTCSPSKTVWVGWGVVVSAICFPDLALAIDRSSGKVLQSSDYNFRRLNCAQHRLSCDLTERHLFRSLFSFIRTRR